MVPQRILVLGGGGHGRVVADAAQEAGYPEVAFLDDAPDAAVRVSPIAVAGGMSDLEALRQEWCVAIAAVGDNRLRLRLLDRLRAAGYETPPLIHPRATISRGARLGFGVFAAANSAVNTGTAIGPGVIINTGATVDHDCVLGAGAHVSPGAHLAGDVLVGERAWIGVGAIIKNGVRVGADAIVGAGSVVLRDVPDGRTVYGVPARAV